ncbi:MAG: enolase C-terminal domain-like protein [Verrucomicrobiia bacterium]
MSKPTDIQVTGVWLYFIQVQTRVPLKFGTETLSSVTCARAKVQVMDARGRIATGWGETPLSVQWVWPSQHPYEKRHNSLIEFCKLVARELVGFGAKGHPIEIGYDFIEYKLPNLLNEFNHNRVEKLPYLAGLLCFSLFDIAVHDAYGNLLGLPVYETYCRDFMSRDLSAFLEPAEGAKISFTLRYPADFLVFPRRNVMKVWHLVGGLDPIDADDLTGNEPDDGYPVLLSDWIKRDGLKCLKIKLRGNDEVWDYNRIIRVGALAIQHNVDWLSADFNCTVTDPGYVNQILDRLRDEIPRIYGMILYVEQPFAYELEKNPIDVRSVSARKPLFLDESAHDWRMIRLGRSLGWSGVALKTCKTQTGAILSACWAQAHGMSLMVQDLTNPMLAQIPHLMLAAHLNTIMGVETNSMQFYPEASRPEAMVHPGVYSRKNGVVDLSTVQGSGFGYRIDEVKRELPQPAVEIFG